MWSLHVSFPCQILPGRAKFKIFFIVIAVAAVLLAKNVSSCHRTASDANYWMIHPLFLAVSTSCLEDLNFFLSFLYCIFSEVSFMTCSTFFRTAVLVCFLFVWMHNGKILKPNWWECCSSILKNIEDRLYYKHIHFTKHLNFWFIVLIHFWLKSKLNAVNKFCLMP